MERTAQTMEGEREERPSVSVGRVLGLWRLMWRRKRDSGLFRWMDGVVVVVLGVSAVSDPVGRPLSAPPSGEEREEFDMSVVVVGR